MFSLQVCCVEEQKLIPNKKVIHIINSIFQNTEKVSTEFFYSGQNLDRFYINSNYLLKLANISVIRKYILDILYSKKYSKIVHNQFVWIHYVNESKKKYISKNYN